MKKLIRIFLLMCMIYTTLYIGTVSAAMIETEDGWYAETYNGRATIYGYNGNDEVVAIPSMIDDCSVVLIKNFGANDKVTTVNIPDSVELISFNAFADCTNLKVVNIGAGVKDIGGTLDFQPNASQPDPVPTGTETPASFAEDAILAAQDPWQPAFKNCINLEEFIVSPDNTVFSSEDGVLFNKDKTMLLLCPEGKIGSYTVPDSVMAFDDRGEWNGYLWSPFYHCSKLEELIIPDSVVGKIENSAGMTSLKRIYIGKGITNITDYNYENILRTPSLESIEISSQSENYTTEDGVVFNKDKSKLELFPRSKGTIYTAPSTVKEISEYAFADTAMLSEIILPETLEVIGFRAFRNCQVKNIEIPSGVKEIQEGAFSGSAIESFNWPEHLEVIKAGMFVGCENLKNIVLPKSLKEIERGALAWTAIENVDWPENVAVVRYHAFQGCKNLNSIKFPEGVTTVEEWAFYESGVEEIVFPKSLKNIDDSAFYKASALKTIYCTGSE